MDARAKFLSCQDDEDEQDDQNDDENADAIAGLGLCSVNSEATYLRFGMPPHVSVEGNRISTDLRCAV